MGSKGRFIVLNREVREGLCGKRTFEQGLKEVKGEPSVETCWKSIPGCGNRHCRGSMPRG